MLIIHLQAIFITAALAANAIPKGGASMIADLVDLNSGLLKGGPLNGGLLAGLGDNLKSLNGIWAPITQISDSIFDLQPEGINRLLDLDLSVLRNNVPKIMDHSQQLKEKMDQIDDAGINPTDSKKMWKQVKKTMESQTILLKIIIILLKIECPIQEPNPKPCDCSTVLMGIKKNLGFIQQCANATAMEIDDKVQECEDGEEE